MLLGQRFKPGDTAELNWKAQEAVRQEVKTWLAKPAKGAVQKVTFAEKSSVAEELPVLPSPVGEGSSNEEPESPMMGSVKDEKNTMEGFQWDSLLEAPIQVQLGQLLRLVPNFHKALLTAGEGVTAAGVKSAAPMSIMQGDPVPESPITDTRVPEISVEYRGIRIDND